jgi:O-antigen/teichoic acid export membrane protein
VSQETKLRAPTTYTATITPVPSARGRRSRVSLKALRRDTAANLIGRGWVAVAALVFVPLYIKLLGVEAYGLVGFAATLQIGLSLLDVGLATTLNRELARMGRDSSESAEKKRDLVRTLEIIYWVAALVIVVLVELAAPAIAQRWLHPERLSTEAVETAVRLMGLTIALQFPFTLYEGGLLGIGRQVALNVILVLGATLRFGAVVAVLVWVSTTVEAFFVWQVAVSVVQTVAGGWLLWRSLPRSGARPRFRTALLADVWRFAAGMAGISLTAVVLTQMDKIVVSKLLSLTAFGYYTLAASAAGVLYVLFLPLFQAVFPRFAQVTAAGDERELAKLYHRSAQAMAALVLPAAAVLAFFSYEVMLVWTRSADAAVATRWVVTLFAAGTAINGLMNVPYALQLAAGWTKLAVYTNLVAIAVLLPTIAVLAGRYGAVGAAIVWVVLNLGYATIGVGIMHRRLLRGHLGRWYGRDVGLPLLASAGTAGAIKLLTPVPSSGLGMTAVIALALVATYVVTSASTPAGRNVLRRKGWQG